MLKKEVKINDSIIENMLSWCHSGFHVYIGDRITPSDKTGLGNLARYIIRTCFSQERMVYVPAEDSADGVSKVAYTSKDRKSRKVFKFLTFRLRTGLAGQAYDSYSRQNWARLIQKIYEVDPLVCPKCQGSMKIISFIDEVDVIEKILRHLHLWDVRNHDPPQKVLDYILELVCDETDSRIPIFVLT